MKFVHDKALRTLAIIGAGMLVIGGIILFFNLGGLPQKLVLRFDAFRGVEFGVPGDLVWMWILVVVMEAINIVLANVLFFRDRVFSYLLAGANIILSILFLAAIGVIFSIN